MLARLIWESLTGFFRHNGPMLAGAIACFSLMALVPFFLLLVSLFGYILGEHPAFYVFLASRLVAFFPDATSEITEELGKIISYRRIGLFTLAVYAYFSCQLYFSLESAVNTIFGTQGKRPLALSLLLSLSVITGLIVLTILAFGAASLFPLFVPLSRLFPVLVEWDVTALLIAFMLPAALVFIAASGLYTVLPHRKITVRHALYGALITAVLFEFVKHAFSYYVVMKLSRFGNIYGPLGAFVIFLLWIFLAACIFLLGAEVVHNLGNAERDRNGTEGDAGTAVDPGEQS